MAAYGCPRTSRVDSGLNRGYSDFRWRGYFPGAQLKEIHKLNDLVVKNAKAREKEYRLSDGGGLYLVVTPSGGKLWRWSYEFHGK